MYNERALLCVPEIAMKKKKKPMQTDITSHNVKKESHDEREAFILFRQSWLRSFRRWFWHHVAVERVKIFPKIVKVLREKWRWRLNFFSWTMILWNLIISIQLCYRDREQLPAQVVENKNFSKLLCINLSNTYFRSLVFQKFHCFPTRT